MGLTVLGIGFQFLIADPINYIKIAYNFSRHFDHRNNIAWTFLGYVTITCKKKKTSFGTLYPCPQASDQIAKLQEELQERLNDMEKVFFFFFFN